MSLRNARGGGGGRAGAGTGSRGASAPRARAALGLAMVWPAFAAVACGSGDDFEQAPAPLADAAPRADASPPGDALADSDAAPHVGVILPTTNGLQSIWGSSNSDVWAVGDMGTIVHFDGHTWALVPSGVTENLTCLTGTGPKDVWA